MAPQNIQVNSLSASQLELTWDPPPADSQNGNIQGYKAMLLFLSWFHLSCLAFLLLVRWLYNYSCPHCTRQIKAVFGLSMEMAVCSKIRRNEMGGRGKKGKSTLLFAGKEKEKHGERGHADREAATLTWAIYLLQKQPTQKIFGQGMFWRKLTVFHLSTVPKALGKAQLSPN